MSFDLGDKVLIVTNTGFRGIRVESATVAKKYKNDNVVLDGKHSDGQWRQSGMQAGHRDIWSRHSYIVHADSDYGKKLLESAKHGACLAKIERMANLISNAARGHKISDGSAKDIHDMLSAVIEKAGIKP